MAGIEKNNSLESGDMVERVSRRYNGPDWRAGMVAIIKANGFVLKEQGSPMIYAGDNLLIPHRSSSSSGFGMSFSMCAFV